MSLAFETTEVKFYAATGGVKTLPGTVTFKRNIAAADASVKGYEIGFTGDDHHLYQQQIRVKNVQTNGPTVTFEVDLALRDKSGHYDDKYEGKVWVLVTADLDDARGDNA
jgi:hypothetical protein